MERIQRDDSAEEKNSSGPAKLMWKEFVGNTTLHGLRYVFMRRSKWMRALWLVLILMAAAYYSVIVVHAVQKFLARPMNTAISTKYVDEMDFPAVTICPLNKFSLRKLYLRDNDDEFAKKGLNMSECAATAGVRGERPCGVAILCCCGNYDTELSVIFPECTEQYRQQLISALNEKALLPNTKEFLRRYGSQAKDIMGALPICLFGVHLTPCNSTDFDPVVKHGGMCFTFNSGKKKSVQRVKHRGTMTGLNIMLDAQVSDYSIGRFSQGFKMIVHNQGEYIDEWSGVNVSPGSYAVVIISRGEVTNLPAPYATKCKEKTLKQFTQYTRGGCAYECAAENNINKCGCRHLGHQGATEDARFCSSLDQECIKIAKASFDHSSCDCEVPCSLVKYKTTISYSTFPNYAMNKYLDAYRYNWTEEYRSFVWRGNSKKKPEACAGAHYQERPSLLYSTNLVFLQVGYTSLSYEIQEQRPAYDRGAMFGEIGGNMGLLLGCSLLTLCEFVDFLASVLMSRRERRVLPV